MRGRVLVAMSGGVDSSVAAAILHEAGYDVIGVAMRLAPERGADGPPKEASCCSFDDFEDARRVAERVGFPFYVIDLRQEFSDQVIKYFVSEYLDGRTPNPCAMCNREIKFERLFERARAFEADYVATGHYARIVSDGPRRFRLLRAVDRSKDQSYFLFALGRNQLPRTLFPLGEITKAEVRARARALGLANADKRESQEICFVAGGDYARFIEDRVVPARLRPGRIIDGDGRPLARHDGIHRFTVGQRRGLGLSAPRPLYVRQIRSADGDVVVGAAGDLRSEGLVASEVSLLDPSLACGVPAPVEVKIRYRRPPLAATLEMTAHDRALVRFGDEGPAVTPGQACVFYRGDEVLGGGFIERAIGGRT